MFIKRSYTDEEHVPWPKPGLLLASLLRTHHSSYWGRCGVERVNQVELKWALTGAPLLDAAKLR